jgi:purine-nucleoside phosphorylase
MTPHISAKKHEYHPIVLMPGDPLRAEYIAKNFLSNTKKVNNVRNCYGFSGSFQGKKVSVQASGMGQPSLGIYATELFNNYGVEKIIRVGSCGGISKKIKVGDIVVAMTASTESQMTQKITPGFHLSPVCDYELLKKFIDKCPQAHVGSIVSNDFFYQPEKKWFQNLHKIGVLAVEMETHLLYSLAMLYGKKALSVNTVSDHMFFRKKMSVKEREQGLDVMITKVLESL